MRIRFWGTRGSIARPGPTTLRYGGNTSCVEVVADDGTWVVLDCGTGVYGLSLDLRRRGALPARGHLLIGHAHWDHIQGFPFFDPLYDASSEWCVYAPGDRMDRLQRTFEGQMSPEHHPIALCDLHASVRFRVLKEGAFEVGGIRVTAQYLHHPALTLGYRLEADGACFVYASDHEPHAVSPEADGPGALPVHPEDRRHVAFLEGADLVVHDTQYTLAEYPARRGWGHTPVECAVDYALAAGAKSLALYHHDPDRDDEAVDELVALARARVAAANAPLDVFAAAEGQERVLGGRSEARAVADTGGARAPARSAPASGASALFPAAAVVRTVLLAEDDPAVGQPLGMLLREDGLRLVEVGALDAALDVARRAPPSLLLLDLRVPRHDLLAACRTLRSSADPRLQDLPILVVTGDQRGREVEEVFDAGATDHLARPVKLTLLRSRIHGWLLRHQGR